MAFLTILDDHIRYVWIVLLKSKAEVSNHVKNFITRIQTQHHITQKIVNHVFTILFISSIINPMLTLPKKLRELIENTITPASP